jgi:hypothetical protein
LATVEITTALVTAHTAAGGTLPPGSWIAAMATVIFIAGLAVFTRRVTVMVALPGLVAAQLLLHVYLALLTPVHGSPVVDPTAHATALGSAHHPSLLSWPMLATHAVGAVVTAAIWELRARSIDVVVAWADTGLPTLPVAPRGRRRAARAKRSRGLQVWLLAPRRGPPVISAHA